METDPKTANRWGDADPVERTKADPNRSYREDALVEEIERHRAFIARLREALDSFLGAEPNPLPIVPCALRKLMEDCGV